ncbi:ABC transporter permease [Mucilaginibacter gotjawali]|nr:ABC transporter permease [Mucilaginibacter gotjawali]MBB3054119.1 putative ABC transport system permease protein [Mucilaginibacter gotjawali]
MIKNFIITAWRSLKTNRVFSFINVFGLSVGLACCMLIGAYLYQELTYDRYAVNANQLYRVELHSNGNNSAADFPSVDVAVGQGIKNAFPEVLDFTRLTRRGPVFVKYAQNEFKENAISIADPNFFRLFSIPVIEGDGKTALTEPKSVVITKAFEKKYFGSSSGLGKAIIIGNDLVKVTGIINELPATSHFHADAFISMATYVTPNSRQTWSNVGYFTYLLLNKNADPKKLEAGFPQLVAKFVVPEIQHDMGVSLSEAQKSVNSFIFFLQPLTYIHLHSATKYEFEANGDIHYVYIFGALAIFILLLACINFTNLSTASATRRSKEIGIRKVLGSAKNSIVSQFLVESVMLTFLAMLIAIGLVYLLLPYFNNLSGKQIYIGFFLTLKALIVEIVLTLTVGIVAGTYPAFFLSSFQIISILKGNSGAQPANRAGLRSSLIVLQFAISTALIIATFVVYQQLHFMQDKKLGYDKNQVLVINDTYTLGNNINAFKQQLLNDNRIVSATISGNVPGYNNQGGTEIYVKDLAEKGTRNEIQCGIYWIQNSYIPTLGMHLAKGRNFYPSGPADSASVIINEAAVRDLGFGKSDPIGKTIIRSGQRHFTIVGVVKDFNYTSAKQKIAPLMMLSSNNSNGAIIVRIKTADVHQLINDIKKQWSSYNAGAPFSYSFLDDQFASLYKSEESTGRIFTSFAILALIIASLGLFGLAAFMIRQRVKEIGIRKVLGASTVTIIAMLSKEFLKLIVIASLIAFPLTWYAMHKWLEDFAYRVTVQWWVFLVAGAVALLVAAITISFQSIKAALANPVKSLRSE